MKILLSCGHWYEHRPPVELMRAPDTVMGVGVKPPEKCPRCLSTSKEET